MQSKNTALHTQEKKKVKKRESNLKEKRTREESVRPSRCRPYALLLPRPPLPGIEALRSPVPRASGTAANADEGPFVSCAVHAPSS